MSSNTFLFELVSPERVLSSEPAQMVVIPGEAGDFGVLAGHAPLLSSIRPGVIDVHGTGGARKRLFVAGGFADVSATQCTVLAEQAVNVEELSRAQIEQELKDLAEDLELAKTPQERARAEEKISLAKARLAAAAGN